MAKPLRQLSPRHHQAVAMRLSGESPGSIAERLGVRRRTVYLWFGDPMVQRELHDRSRQIGNEVVSRLAEHTLSALDGLQELVQLPMDRASLTPEEKLAVLRELFDRCQFTARIHDATADAPARRARM